ncbi:hypothetical protein BIWAKO_03212 [Bosea sp. BIWAKO-01]|nr:hypothetical protein BIWAKO_03212 [Bosea sp. BIWAKO-01]
MPALPESIHQGAAITVESCEYLPESVSHLLTSCFRLANHGAGFELKGRRRPWRA